jgi:hypothetical protein
MQSAEEIADRREITELLQNWVVWRDAPEGYRHLAYIQTRIGYTVKPDMPGLKGPEVERLYQRGAVWLEGGSL